MAENLVAGYCNRRFRPEETNVEAWRHAYLSVVALEEGDEEQARSSLENALVAVENSIMQDVDAEDVLEDLEQSIESDEDRTRWTWSKRTTPVLEDLEQSVESDEEGDR